MFRIKLSIVVLLLWTFLPEAHGFQKETAPDSHTIHKGTTFRTFYLDYFVSEDDDRDINIINLNLEWGYYILKPLSFIGGFHILQTYGYRIDKKNPERKKIDASVTGLGSAGTVRLDLVRSNRVTVFSDASLGFLLCSDEIPPGGTFWNFTQRYSAGITVRILRKINLLLGARRMHISNGGYHRNPSHNGNGGFIGVMYGF